MRGFEYHLQATAVKYLWRYRYKGKPLEDLKKARWYLTSSLGSTRTDMQHNSDFRYDLKRGQEAEEWFAGLLTSDSIECKRDYRAHDTGNVFVEFESRGKPSGIRKTEAEHWAFIYGPSEL